MRACPNIQITKSNRYFAGSRGGRPVVYDRLTLNVVADELPSDAAASAAAARLNEPTA